MLMYLQMIESEADKSKFERLYLKYQGLMTKRKQESRFPYVLTAILEQIIGRNL